MQLFSSKRRRLVLLASCVAIVGIATLVLVPHLRQTSPSSRLLLAAMIGVTEPCIFAQPAAAGTQNADLEKSCTGPTGSAGALIESTLSQLSPAGATPKNYELGYTLPVPLLKLLKASGNNWVIDQEAVERIARTIRDTNRSAIVYLFATHFAAGAPIEEVLNADIRNLSQTPKGPLPRDKYFDGSKIFNWTFASTDTPITHWRIQAVQALLAEICKLEPRQIAKIKGITLLGETHHLFPDFQGGAGFDRPYLVSDYSESSKTGFRAFLQRKYGSIKQLNADLGTHWISFDQVDPPSKDIRTTTLRDFTEHIDSFAHGSLPISGWVYVRAPQVQSPPIVRIYLNGGLIGKAEVTLGRRDVLEAKPEMGDTNTGWRFDMDFRNLPAGLHRIDVFLEDGPNALVHLASRRIAIMNRQQETPQPVPQKDVPPSREPDDSIKSYVDLPVDQSSYFYNPLVPLWHAFRGQQVVDYLEFFAKVVRQSCLTDTTLYTHQIIPFTNPSWDENKYAIQPSLQQLKDIHMGVSLYGEPTYGKSFTNWLLATSPRNYGITEFHPMKAMNAADFESMLTMHQSHGAQFISFFLEPRWHGKLVPRDHNLFSLDPENPKYGSKQLYESAREVLANSSLAIH